MDIMTVSYAEGFPGFCRDHTKRNIKSIWRRRTEVELSSEENRIEFKIQFLDEDSGNRDKVLIWLEDDCYGIIKNWNYHRNVKNLTD